MLSRLHRRPKPPDEIVAFIPPPLIADGIQRLGGLGQHPGPLARSGQQRAGEVAARQVQRRSVLAGAARRLAVV